MNEMRLIFTVWEVKKDYLALAVFAFCLKKKKKKSKRTLGLKVHQDGSKPIYFLEWRSVVASVSDDTPFGPKLELQDVDQFWVDRIEAKLKYWSFTHMLFADIMLIVNKVLMSSLWYFIMVWLAQRKSRGRLKLCYTTTSSQDLRTLQEHG